MKMKVVRKRAASFVLAFAVLSGCVFGRSGSVLADTKESGDVLAAASDSQTSSVLGAAQDYNLVCFGDFKNRSSDIWGASAIGGAITVSSFAFGSHFTAGPEQPYSLVWGAKDATGSSFSNGVSAKTKALVSAEAVSTSEPEPESQGTDLNEKAAESQSGDEEPKALNGQARAGGEAQVQEAQDAEDQTEGDAAPEADKEAAAGAQDSEKQAPESADAEQDENDQTQEEQPAEVQAASVVSGFTFDKGWDTWTDDEDLKEKAGFTFDELHNELKETSEEIADLAEQNGTEPASKSADSKELQLTGNGSTNFFNISAEALNTYDAVWLKTPADSTDIINVSGADVRLPRVNYGKSGNNLANSKKIQHLLWNLSEAETVTNVNSVEGSVLAPDAEFTPTAGSGNFEGTLIVDSFKTSLENGGFEGHHDPFEGTIEDLPAPEEDGGLTVEKTAKLLNWNQRTYQIDLSVAAQAQMEAQPSDVILVLDRSGSMKEDYYAPVSEEPPSSDNGTYYIYNDGNGVYWQLSHNKNGWYYYRQQKKHYVQFQPNGTGQNNYYQFYTKTNESKLDVLKEAAKDFVTSLAKNSPDSRVAVVSFASDYNTNGSSQGDPKAVTNDTDGLVSLDDDEGGANTVRTAIQGLEAEGGTISYLGLYEARQIFKADNNGTADRSRYVVMFTDGQPGEYGFGAGNGGSDKPSGERAAASAINEAQILKAARGESQSSVNNVFRSSYGVGEGVGDNDYPGTPASGDGCGATVYTVGLFSGRDADDQTKIDEYMTRVATDEDHYLTVSDTDSLGDIFGQIASGISGTVTVTDVLDFRFELAEGEKARLEGKGATVRANDDGTTITWTLTPDEEKQDWSWDTDLTVQAKPEFIGGNNVPTNTSNSGVSYGDGQFAEFPQPTVNVKPVFGAKNSSVTIFRGETVPTDKAEACKPWTDPNVTFQWYQSDEETPVAEANTVFPSNLTPDDNTRYILKATYDCGTPTPGSNENTTDEYGQHIAGDQAENYILTTEGIYHVTVVKGELDLTKVMNEQYPAYDPDSDTPVNPRQSFVFRITRSDTPGGKVQDTFYEVITPGADEDGTKKIIKGLKKGYYRITEERSAAWRYDQKSVNDNDATGYTDGTNQDGVVFIGRQISTDEPPTGASSYFGSEGENKATVSVTNNLTNRHWFGDTTVAVNTIQH